MESKEKRIDKERKELIEYFDNTENKLALKLIDNASFMRVTLQDLEKHINKNGVKEDWNNGANQYGIRESIEAKTYKDMIKNYIAVIKQLNDMLPKTSKDNNKLEEFKNF